MTDLLSDEEIAQQLPDDWDRDGDTIVRVYEFDDFLGAAGFAGAVAGLAEDAWHHPDGMEVRWGELEVRLTTHDAGGITEKDIALAERIDGIY